MDFPKRPVAGQRQGRRPRRRRRKGRNARGILSSRVMTMSGGNLRRLVGMKLSPV